MGANIYCSPNDMSDILSANGVALRSDDAPPSQYGGAAEKAGNKIDFYCWKRYDPSALATSDLVKDWAATLACFYLSIRRGNPPPSGISILYEQALADLKEIQKASADIPGIGVRSIYAPGLSVMRATMRPYPRSVVETSQGTHLGGEVVNSFHHSDAWDTWGPNNNLTQIF